MVACLVCLVGNYEVQCIRCGKGYCHRCFRKDVYTGYEPCLQQEQEVMDWSGRLTWIPANRGRHSYHFKKPEPPDLIKEDFELLHGPFIKDNNE